MRRICLLSAFVAAVALAAPVPRKPHVPITAANAARVRPVQEVTVKASRIVRGPGKGELAFVGWETPIEVVSDADLRPLRTIASKRRVIHFAATDGGKRLAWNENTTRVVLQKDGGKPVEIETGQDQAAPTFSPDGKLLATGGYGSHVTLWDAEGKPVRRLYAGTEGGLTAVFSPDGKLLAVGNRNELTRVYEVSTGKLLHILRRACTHEIAFNPAGDRLAVAYVDGRVGVWDVKSGKQLALKPTGASDLYTLDWSPKGDVLATAGLEGRLTLWDPRDLTVLAERDAPAWVIQVRFTADGTRLLASGASEGSGTRDRKVVAWGVR